VFSAVLGGAVVISSVSSGYRSPLHWRSLSASWAL